MQFKQEQLNPCEVQVEVETQGQQVAAAIGKAYKEIGQHVAVPGFRKGKAPRALLERVVDKDRVRGIAADELLQACYKEFLDESKLEPLLPAGADVVEFDIDKPEEPFKAKFLVPLEPVVELGEYKGLEIEKEIYTVSEEDIDGEIKRFLEHATDLIEVVDRPAQDGDAIMLLLSQADQEEEQARPLKAVVGENLPDFDKAIRGMNVGEEKTFDITYPEDYGAEDLRGQSKAFKATMLSINERKIPEATDEWVAGLFEAEGEKHPELRVTDDETQPKSIAELREFLRGRMQKRVETASEDAVKSDIFKKVVEAATVHYPQALIDEAVHERIHELAESLKERNVSIEDYLQYRQTTAEDLQKQFVEDETNTLRNSLVAREIVKQEGIKVEDSDVDAEIEATAANRKTSVEAMRAYLEKTNSIGNMREQVIKKKLFELLVGSAKIKEVQAKTPAEKSED